MEIGSVRPAMTGVVAPTPRAPTAQDTAVRTELPGPAAVTDAPKGEATGYETRSQSDERPGRTETAKAVSEQLRGEKQERSREVERQYEYDQQTQAFVMKKIDMQSGDVVEQVPDEAVLRMRAAIQAWDNVLSGKTQASAVDVST